MAIPKYEYYFIKKSNCKLLKALKKKYNLIATQTNTNIYTLANLQATIKIIAEDERNNLRIRL